MHLIASLGGMEVVVETPVPLVRGDIVLRGRHDDVSDGVNSTDNQAFVDDERLRRLGRHGELT